MCVDASMCIYAYATYRIHLALFTWTCVQGIPLGIGKPMWEFLPGGNRFAQQPWAICSTSSRGETMQNLPCPHSTGVVVTLVSFRQPYCWDGYISPATARECYLTASVLGLWLLPSSYPPIVQISWALGLGAVLQMYQLGLGTSQPPILTSRGPL